MPQRPVIQTTPPRPQPQVAQQPQPQQAQNKLKTKRLSGFGSVLKKWWWLGLIILVFVALAGYFAYSYFDTKAQLEKSGQNGTNSANSADMKAIIDEVNKYLELPTETPAMATINDVSQVQGQEFFKNAQNGDVVLIFSAAGRGLLYRPSTHKIIEYTKVDLASPDANKSP